MSLVGGSIPSVGVVMEGVNSVCDHRIHSANYPSVVCREMGYPWALGVAHVTNTGFVSSADSGHARMNPDGCAAEDAGYASECSSASECSHQYDIAVNCRGTCTHRL